MKYIALLRGINVGGHRRILMADLKQMFENLKFKNITTYIQSGNVVFESDQQEDQADLQTKIEKEILKKFNFEVPIIIRSSDEWNTLITNSPFPSNDIERLHLTLLETLPTPAAIEGLQTFNYPPDQWQIENNNIYVFCTQKYSNTKYTNDFFAKKLKIKTTTRNWKTVLKLQELAK